MYLTEFKNYNRVIPAAARKKMEKAQDLKLFDAYVVMHMDAASMMETQQEKKERREKDPILFGLIDGSDRLYFIDDWEDEYCDLTLDQIVDKLDLEEDDFTLTGELTKKDII